MLTPALYDYCPHCSGDLRVEMCRYCGRTLPLDARFCPGCAQPLATTEAVEPQEAPPVPEPTPRPPFFRERPADFPAAPEPESPKKKAPEVAEKPKKATKKARKAAPKKRKAAEKKPTASTTEEAVKDPDPKPFYRMEKAEEPSEYISIGPLNINRRAIVWLRSKVNKKEGLPLMQVVTQLLDAAVAVDLPMGAKHAKTSDGIVVKGNFKVRREDRERWPTKHIANFMRWACNWGMENQWTPKEGGD